MTEPRRARLDLEKALTELEKIVSDLEAGDMPLEKSLKEFERGVRLSRECQSALREAEKKVQVLMGNELKDFAGTDQADDEPEEEDEDPDADD
jgi:exodeoxyribonuclease VII small subunit